MSRIVFLIANYVPHQVTTIKSLIEIYNVEIHSFSISENYTYIPVNINGLYTYNNSNFTKKELLKKIMDLKPAIVVIAGWMITDYVWVARKIKKTHPIPIVAYSDTPWYGTYKQKINVLISPFYIRRAFTHMWVAGIYQYDYARKLGFDNHKIIFNSLCANIELFKNINIRKKEEFYPKSFLYIGRMTSIKGLDVLQKAWNDIIDKKEWTLTLIGDGEQKEMLKKDSSIIVKDYMSQIELLDEMKKSGCFILPSKKESWALVLHEAAAAGLPIICTRTCGAAPHFVIDGYNGYKVNPNNVSSLKKAIESIISLDTKRLINYSENSRILSNSITPHITAASLMQLYK